MPLITWQLWLARDIVRDNPLLWQKTAPKLTPGKVVQSIGAILVVIQVQVSCLRLKISKQDTCYADTLC
jgi:hypothetical protein